MKSFQNILLMEMPKDMYKELPPDRIILIENEYWKEWSIGEDMVEDYYGTEKLFEMDIEQHDKILKPKKIYYLVSPMDLTEPFSEEELYESASNFGSDFRIVKLIDAEIKIKE